MPPAPYVGGKRNLASRLRRVIDGIPHQIYVEPFVGMGGVFFRRSQAAPAEVINDYNRDVANLFRILQRHMVPFTDMLRWQLTTRADFDRLRDTPADALTDLERAARFIYLQRLGFGGKVIGRNFASGTRSARFDVTRLIPQLEDIHARLASVTIECLPWQDVLERYDGPDTLFYLDPPYFGTEDYYDAPFRRDEFGLMAERLRSLKGRFVMSINDTPEMRTLFSGLEVTPVDVIWSFNGPKKRPRGELLISDAPLRGL